LYTFLLNFVLNKQDHYTRNISLASIQAPFFKVSTTMDLSTDHNRRPPSVHFIAHKGTSLCHLLGNRHSNMSAGYQ
jgi:hypothetical protein